MIYRLSSPILLLLSIFAKQQLTCAYRGPLTPLGLRGHSSDSSESKEVDRSAAPEVEVSDTGTFNYEGKQWSLIVPNCSNNGACGGSASTSIIADNIWGDHDTGVEIINNKSKEKRGVEFEEDESQSGILSTLNRVGPLPKTPWADLEMAPKRLMGMWLKMQYIGSPADPDKPPQKGLILYQAAPLSMDARPSKALLFQITRSREARPQGPWLDQRAEIEITNRVHITLNYIISPYIIYSFHYIAEVRVPPSDPRFLEQYNVAREKWSKLRDENVHGVPLWLRVNLMAFSKPNFYEGDARIAFLRERLLLERYKYESRDPGELWFYPKLAKVKDWSRNVFDWSIMTRNEAIALETLLKTKGTQFTAKARDFVTALNNISWFYMTRSISRPNNRVKLYAEWEWLQMEVRCSLYALEEAISNPDTKFQTPRQGDYRYMYRAS
ncbi:MAG: hypothetical protein M1831_004716 [Alyxoria varia]|nr:MAG: hypothetical protein M1831_004716 [Alyxoria varia]